VQVEVQDTKNITIIPYFLSIGQYRNSVYQGDLGIYDDMEESNIYKLKINSYDCYSKVPSLEDRIDDIELLVNHFVNEISSEMGLLPRKFSKKAIDELKKSKWPGNIRELRNVVERLLILCSGAEIGGDDVVKYR